MVSIRCPNVLLSYILPRHLDRNPESRFSAREALAHPWLSSPAGEDPKDKKQPTVDTPGEGRSAANVSEEGGASSASAAGGALMPSPDRVFRDTLVQRLQRFGSYPRLRRLALSRLAQIVSTERPDLLQPLWRYFADALTSPEGRIPCRSVSELLQDGRQFDLAASEVEQLLASFHQHKDEDDGPGGEGKLLINRFEWAAAMIDWHRLEALQEWEAWTEAVFSGLDKEHDGVITRQNLEEAICSPPEASVASGDNDDGDVDGMCPFPDAIPGVLREVGHFEAANDARIDIAEFRRVLMDGAEADSLDLFESRRVDGSSN